MALNVWYIWHLTVKFHGVKSLTFITDSKANVGVALVRGEEEVQEVGGADEELRNLSALVATNKR